jgi:undecaprenyl-phosphate galactose phosphotransferase
MVGFALLRMYRSTPAIILFSDFPISGRTTPVDTYLIAAVFFVIVRFILGDYARRQLFWEEARGTTKTLALLSIFDICLGFIVTGSAMRPLVASWVFTVVAVPLARQGARRLLCAFGLWQIPVAIANTGPVAVETYNALGTSLSLGFDIRYLIALPGDTKPVPELRHLKQIGATDPAQLAARLHETECAQVIIPTDGALSLGTGDLVQRVVGGGIGVVVVPALHGLPLFGMQTNYFFGKNTLLLQLQSNLTRVPSRAIKTVTDLVGSAVLLTLLLPVFLILAFAIRLDSEGPIFFVQRRVGRGGREFPCIKFRTMVIDAEQRLDAWRSQNPDLYAEYVRSNFKLKEDPRVTRLGAILRRWSLDELPQLLNVLTGDMSLVGPRPLLAREISSYGAAFDLYCRVHPGITGLWQTRGRSETRFADRIALDEWYILNWSYWYDIVILLQTARTVFFGSGAF